MLQVLTVPEISTQSLGGVWCQSATHAVPFVTGYNYRISCECIRGEGGGRERGGEGGGEREGRRGEGREEGEGRNGMGEEREGKGMSDSMYC